MGLHLGYDKTVYLKNFRVSLWNEVLSKLLKVIATLFGRAVLASFQKLSDDGERKFLWVVHPSDCTTSGDQLHLGTLFEARTLLLPWTENDWTSWNRPMTHMLHIYLKCFSFTLDKGSAFYLFLCSVEHAHEK
jgi:hypothetical protein